MKTPLPMPANVDQTIGLEQQSYFVFVEGSRPPTIAHPNRFAARTEARRLAGILPGRTVHVCKVRETYVNSLPLPDDVRADRDQRSAANRAKQVAAREGMKVGSFVEVKAAHYRYADSAGYIERMGEGDDVTVYVKLTGIPQPVTGDPVRFSPSSLTLLTGKEQDAPRTASPDDRAPRCGDLVHYAERGIEREGEIKHIVRPDASSFAPGVDEAPIGYLIRDIIDNIVMPRRYARDEFVIHTHVEDRPDGARKTCDETKSESPADDFITAILAGLAGAALRRMMGKRTDSAGPANPEKVGTAMPLGTEVMVIVGSNPLFGTAVEAKLSSYDDDVRFVWVHMRNEDGSYDEEPVKANQSRLVRKDDPAYKILHETA